MRLRPVYSAILLVFVFCLYHLPWIWLGESAFYNGFDSLDSYVVWYRMVVEGGYSFAPSTAIVQQVMTGLPKYVLVNSFSYYYLLNLLFPTFLALNVQIVSASLAGMAGMWLLVRKYWKLDRLAASFLSLSFAFTPFLPAWTMSISGQPLLLYALLNLREKNSRWWNWAIIAAFPFVSNFQSAGVFILGAIASLIIYDLYQKRPSQKLVLAFIILLVLYLPGKLSLMANLLGGEDFISHRTEMLRYAADPWVCLKIFVRYFLFGNIDVALSLHTLFLLPLVIGVFIYTTVKTRRFNPQLTVLLLAITGICAYVAALNWEPFVSLRNQSPLLKMYSMERFHIFLQLLWHLAAAQSLVLLGTRYRKMLLTFAFAGQMVVCFAYQPTYYACFVKPFINIKPYHYIYRYEDYYAVRTFDLIKRRTGRPAYNNRVASIGIPPAISQYNGLWTIDGYVTNYPLTYKHAFREIISGELAKDPTIMGFFDGWGSQCLLLYDQGGGNFNTHVTRDLAPPERDLQLDGNTLKGLGCRYVLSAETLKDPEKSGLAPIETYHSEIWSITLYEVK